MITFKDVTKRYGDTPAVSNVNIHIEKGEFFVLIGPSGCGKTTSLKMINRLIEPTSGQIYINGEDIQLANVEQLRWNIGYVLQQIGLFPTMTVAENISIVPEMKKWSKDKISKRIDELLTMVGLDPKSYRNRKTTELSGGEQQRVGVVRALAGNPDIILMDEPFSALDPISREQLQADVKELHQTIKKTIVFVTHDMKEAMKLADRICLIREGEVVQLGTPEEIRQSPANDFVKDFIGSHKTVWDASVSDVMERDSIHMTSNETLLKSPAYPAPLYVFDSENTFLGRLDQEGTVTHDVVVEPEQSLADALSIVEKSSFDYIPVVDDQKLIGVIGYKSIVQYMKRFDRQEEGIVL